MENKQRSKSMKRKGRGSRRRRNDGKGETSSSGVLLSFSIMFPVKCSGKLRRPHSVGWLAVISSRT